MSTSTCAPGMLLLRPQRLKRAALGASDEALLDDLLSLVGKIGVDKAQGGTILTVLEAAAPPMGERLLQRAGGNVTRALTRLQDLVRPLNTTFTQLGSSLGGASGTADAVAALVGLLAKLSEGAAGVSIDTLRAKVGTALDVIQTDLGLTPAAIEAEIWTLFDDVAARLEAIPDEADASVRENRHAVVAIIRRIKLQLQGVVHVPALNADRLASALFDELRGGGVAEALDKISCVGKAAGAGLTVAEDILHVVPFTGFGSHSLGAADPAGGGGSSPSSPPDASKYLWYGSWLLGDKYVQDAYKILSPWFFGSVWRPSRDVWVGVDSKAYFGGKQLGNGSDVPWDQQFQIPEGSERQVRYTFKRIPAGTMDEIARHSAWIADALEALQHIVSPSGLMIVKGGMMSVTDFLELLEASWQIPFKAARQMPWGFFIGRRYGSFAGFALGTALPFVLFNFPGTFQGMHTKGSTGENFKSYLLTFIGDILNLVSAGLIGAALRDGLLSFLTIINYDPTVGDSTSAGNRPDNRSQIDGIVGIFTFLTTLLLIKVVVDRKDYGWKSTNLGPLAKLIFEYGMLGGLAFGIIGGFFGTLIAWTIGTMADGGLGIVDGKVLGLTVLRTALAGASPFSFMPALYGLKENDTGGGTWNPTGAPFNGYPADGSSPYLLPWEAGKNIMCFQGNLGFFSHNFVNPTEQVYAYDLMLDKGTEILASRPGTVVDFLDSVPDGSQTNTAAASPVPGQTPSQIWNFVMIMHDQESAPDALHDLGPGGTKTTTYAIYGHGQQGTVRSSFLANGVQPQNIIGTAVRRGQVIMHADSTGISFCNHVHMEVRPGPPPVPPPTGKPLTPVQLATVSANGSIPFVFKGDGNLKSRRFYKSSNNKVGN